MTWRDLKSCKVELVAVSTVLVVLGLRNRENRGRELFLRLVTMLMSHEDSCMMRVSWKHLCILKFLLFFFIYVTILIK